MIINNFNVSLNKDNVLKACGFDNDGNEPNIDIGQLYGMVYSEFKSVIKPVGGVEIFEIGNDNRLEFLRKENCLYEALVLYTLGNHIDECIRSKFSNGEYMAGIIMDAMAVNYLFEMRESLDIHIENASKLAGLTIKKRFSPYDDIDPFYQKMITDSVEIGVHVNQNMVLEPNKSCSAIIGIGMVDGEKAGISHNCDTCNIQNCMFRKYDLHKIIIVNQNQKKTQSVKHNENLLDVLKTSGCDIPSACNGKGTCGQCKVVVKGKIVNACQVNINKPMEVELLNSIPDKLTILNINDSSKSEPIGIAIDVGTTTIAMSIVSLANHTVIARTSFLNRQRKHGLDVISRILAAENGYLEEMSEIIRDDLANNMIKLCKINSINLENIKKIVITGNTTMMHILLLKPCGTLGRAPFAPVFKTYGEYSFYEIFKQNIINANIYIPPYISAFAGGDILCGMFYCDKYSHDYFLLDLGTNGEMVYSHNNSYTCASTAAGPAFEGVGILWGLGGVEGAISNVVYNNSVFHTKTIGGKPPVGICGSGIIDTVSILLENQLIDNTGLLCDEYFYKGVEIAKSPNNSIIFTQNDIRQVQTAKAAIRSGIDIITNNNLKDIKFLFIAGGFGSEINIKNSIAIGLLPDVSIEKAHFIGNSALEGAQRLLYSQNPQADADKIILKSKYVNLSNYEDFEKIYIQNIDFLPEDSR